jgi:transcription elongation factor GreA
MAYMSQEGYDKLVAQLHQLEAVERPKASAAKPRLPTRVT